MGACAQAHHGALPSPPRAVRSPPDHPGLQVRGRGCKPQDRREADGRDGPEVPGARQEIPLIQGPVGYGGPQCRKQELQVACAVPETCYRCNRVLSFRQETLFVSCHGHVQRGDTVPHHMLSPDTGDGHVHDRQAQGKRPSAERSPDALRSGVALSAQIVSGRPQGHGHRPEHVPQGQLPR